MDKISGHIALLIVLAPKKNQDKNCFQDGDFGKKMIEAAHILKK